MSNPFKAVGKVFKKVAKVVKKVAIPALMIGAVVLTGGAALGALPAIGSILGSIGISGTLASVLGGAISAGAIGAVTGGIGGVLSGKGFMKGATTGFLAGAATGGVLGGFGAIGPNGVLGGLGSAASTTQAVANTGAITGVNSAIPDVAGQFLANTGGLVGTAGGATAATTGVMTAAGGAAGGSGLGGLLGSGGIGPLIQGAGSIISGFASGKAAQAQLEAEQQAQQDKYDRTAFNYGYRNIYGDEDSNVPTSAEQWYQYSPVQYAQPSFLQPGAGLLQTQPSQFLQPSAPPPPQYQIINGKVVPAGVG